METALFTLDILFYAWVGYLIFNRFKLIIENEKLTDKIKKEFEAKVYGLELNSTRIIINYEKNEIEIWQKFNDENFLTATITYDDFFDMTSKSEFEKLISVLEELEVVEVVVVFEEEVFEEEVFEEEVIEKIREKFLNNFNHQPDDISLNPFYTGSNYIGERALTEEEMKENGFIHQEYKVDMENGYYAWEYFKDKTEK